MERPTFNQSGEGGLNITSASVDAAGGRPAAAAEDSAEPPAKRASVGKEEAPAAGPAMPNVDDETQEYMVGWVGGG